MIRDAKDDDADGLIALIGDVYREYDCVFDVDDELPELRALATHFEERGGRAWVAIDDDGTIVGSSAFAPTKDGGVELLKLYVASRMRGSGLGERLCSLVEDEARARGAKHVDLWTDTRFTRAHRFYEKRGYMRGPATRALHDKSASVEYFYRLTL